MQRLIMVCTSGILFTYALPASADGPIPFGDADVAFSYMTGEGLRVLESSVDYSGESSDDVIPLGGDPSIGYFNSVNSFGRRRHIPGAVYENESLLTHALFKPPGNSTEFFDGIVEGASVTLEVRNINFNEPVLLQHDTVMMHKMWDADQVDRLPNFYVNLSNYDTGTDPSRDFDDFFPLVFVDFPQPNYDLGVLGGENGIEIFGDGTDTLGFRITIPYDRLRNFEDVDQEVPNGLPAPFGFLEPFHFHLEFTVAAVPEPGASIMLLAGACCALHRRRKR